MVELIVRELDLFKNPVELNISLLTRSRAPHRRIKLFSTMSNIECRHYTFHRNRVMIFVVSNGFVDCSCIFQQMSLYFKEQEPPLKAIRTSLVV